jgi:hypothetical protein
MNTLVPQKLSWGLAQFTKRVIFFTIALVIGRGLRTVYASNVSAHASLNSSHFKREWKKKTMTYNPRTGGD